MARRTTDTSAEGGDPRDTPVPRHALPAEIDEYSAAGTDADTDADLSDGEAPDAVARPPRPQMERPPAPTSPALVRPDIVGRILRLYYLGMGVGAVGVVSALLWRTGARENLIEMMAGSAADEARKQQVADLVQYGTVGVIVLLLFIQLVLAIRLGAGRRGARPGLLLVVAAQVLLYLFAVDIIRDTGWEGVVVQVGLAVHALASVVATLLSWAPSVGEWLDRASGRRQQQ